MKLNFRSSSKAWHLVLSLGIILSILSVTSSSAPKKLQVTSENADIYLTADKKSAVIETVKKDTILTSASPRKFKKIWNYVYFISQKSGKTKSGYVKDTDVKKLFRNSTGKTIHSK